MRKRLPLVQKPDLGWCVDLPTYTMVPDSVLPVLPTLTTKDGVLAGVSPAAAAAAAPSVLVDFPDNEADPVSGAPSKSLIAAKYAGHPRWASTAWTPPVPL